MGVECTTSFIAFSGYFVCALSICCMHICVTEAAVYSDILFLSTDLETNSDNIWKRLVRFVLAHTAH